MSFDPVLQRALQDSREGRLPQALAAVRIVVQRQPQNADAMQLLGLLLVMAGQFQQAIHHLGRAVALAPNSPASHQNYANALRHLGRNAEAATHYRRAVQLDRNYMKGHLGLAQASLAAGQTAEALAAVEAGLALPGAPPELVTLQAVLLESSEGVEAALRRLDALLQTPPKDPGLHSAWLLFLNYSEREPAAIWSAHQTYHERVSRPAKPAVADKADAERPLRVGFLSSDLRSHSAGHFIPALLEGLPAGMTTVAFSNSPPNPHDPITRRLRPKFSEWHEVYALEAASLNALLRERRIDVLLELVGHANGNRLDALQPKPAPIVVHAIGYPNTTGHPAIDYRLVDSMTDPPGSERWATEKLLRLDPCFLCYQPVAEAPAPMLPPADRPVTFGSFNLTAKISDTTIRLWSECLAAVPESRLLLKAKATADPVHRAYLQARFVDGGIPEDRLEFLSYSASVQEHLALYGRVHVALDPTPYNGTTTTCEALWMGVPVVTLEGDRHAARVGSSLLQAAGRPEWIARSAGEYASIAQRLATDRAGLAQLRSGLRGALAESVLLDAAAYGQRFHAAIRECWRELASKPELRAEG